MIRILYRLPDTLTAHELRCRHVTEVRDFQDLGGSPGYVFAPFSTESPFPTLFFHPDTATSWDIPSDSVSCPIPFTDDAAVSYRHYRNEFQQCLQHLQHGDVEKVVLSRTLSLKLSRMVSEEDLQTLFIAACQHYPHSFVSLVNVPDGTHWLIATPEVLLQKTADGHWHTMALAATMGIEESRLLTPEEWSPKNLEEQRIVAEYIARRLAEIGVEATASPLHTLTAGQIVHLCTDFSLPSSVSLGKLVAVLHPTPAVCGYPTTAARQIITATEHHQRGYYAGFSGPVDLFGGTHLYVTLRCMRLNGGEACLYAGGGLLPASVCDLEWHETQRKLNTMLHVLQ